MGQCEGAEPPREDDDAFALWEEPPGVEGLPAVAAGEVDEWDPDALADWFGDDGVDTGGGI
jgi:hypothetical protein